MGNPITPSPKNATSANGSLLTMWEGEVRLRRPIARLTKTCETVAAGVATLPQFGARCCIQTVKSYQIAGTRDDGRDEMSGGRRRFVAGLGLAAAGLGLAKPALADPNPDVHWRMTS